MSEMLKRKPSIEAQLAELGNKIVAVCMRCPHSRFVVGRFECTVKRAHCHSSRVRRWLGEIKKLEEEKRHDSGSN